MSDYIDRTSAKKAVFFDKLAMNRICSLPAADVVPRELYQRALSDVVTLSVERKHGKWISMMGHSICNVCGYKGSPILTNFCPNCGAEMNL